MSISLIVVNRNDKMFTVEQQSRSNRVVVERTSQLVSLCELKDVWRAASKW